ncbi:MAG: transposase [Gemmatimonadetes bacterium]|nr:transposase [Gemmatimonadota bacterium]
MSPTDELIPVLKKLRMSGVLSSLDIRLRQATEGEISHIEFLYRLLTDEVERRESKQLQLRLNRASFEHQKSLEDFNFSFNPKLPKSKILDLATCRFLDSHTNILLVGPAGVGKSHIAQALGHRACMSGYSCLYVTAHKMLASLRAARADATYERRLARFTTPQLLIIDDLGLRPLQHDEPLDLYEIIRQRYERTATIMTSNRDVAEWYPLFGDDLLASAAMDRQLHHSQILTLEGKSFRTNKNKRSAKAA